jgi:RNA polymerase sigma factor (sigma-70 family)
MRLPENWPDIWRKVLRLRGGAAILGFEDTVRSSDPEERLIGILAYYSPLCVELIPEQLLEECFLIATTVPGIIEHESRLHDVALALAAGWKRPSVTGDRNWDKPWPAAIQKLTAMATDTTNRILQSFAENVMDGGPRGYSHPGMDEVRSWAVEIVFDFISPLPVSAAAYKKYQHLEAWNPEPNHESLRSWLQHAIQGTPGPLTTVQANKFRNGLLFGVMCKEARLLIGDVAFHACCRCGDYSKEFGERKCKQDHVFDPPSSYYVIAKDLLVVPGVYLTAVFRRFEPLNCVQVLLPIVFPEGHEPRPVYCLESLGQCPHEARKIYQRVSNLFIRSEMVSCWSGDFAVTARGEEDEDPTARGEPVDTRSAADGAMWVEVEERIRLAVDELPRPERDIVRMKWLEQRSDLEIARIVGISLGQARQLLTKAKRYLMYRLGPLDVGG